MKTVPNYKDKFEKLLTKEYRKAYSEAVNAILNNLHALTPKTGKLEEFVDSKTKKFAGQLSQIEAATKQVSEKIKTLSGKAREFDEKFGKMECDYVKYPNDQKKKKGEVQKSFKEFGARLDGYLKYVNENGNDAATKLKEVSNKELPKVLLFFYNELHDMPAQLIANAKLAFADQAKVLGA